MLTFAIKFILCYNKIEVKKMLNVGSKIIETERLILRKIEIDKEQRNER